jgi:glycosyltransferase involved in cell wall biosynthesis
MTLRILWASDAADASSGYAVETALTVPRLIGLGHEVALLATYGHQGARREWRGIPVYPGGADPFANDVIGHAARDWRADIVITLKDSHVFRPEAMQGLRWCPLTPVDHDPLPPSITGVLRTAYRPIAYAPHGFRSLRKAGFDPLYCPHGYDPAVYSPLPRNEARAAFNLPQEWFIVGMVAVNRGGVPSRKAWPQNLEAFARFAADKPNARLFLHTYLGTDGFEGSINLPGLAAQLGITDKVLYCDQERYKQGFGLDYMRAFYSMMDVLNATSLGEGFGIPTLEAQACGVPVICGDWCAQEDLCFGGWHVPKDGALMFYDQQGAWVYVPKPEAIAKAMGEAYRAHSTYDADVRTLATLGAAPFAIDRVVAEHWAPALIDLEVQIRTERSRGVLRIIRPEEVLAI